jgi:hypothetical protein
MSPGTATESSMGRQPTTKAGSAKIMKASLAVERAKFIFLDYFDASPRATRSDRGNGRKARLNPSHAVKERVGCFASFDRFAFLDDSNVIEKKKQAPIRSQIRGLVD